MLAGPTKSLARFRILVGHYLRRCSFSHQSIEIDHKTKIAITHPEPVGVCGQMSVIAMREVDCYLDHYLTEYRGITLL